MSEIGTFIQLNEELYLYQPLPTLLHGNELNIFNFRNYCKQCLPIRDLFVPKDVFLGPIQVTTLATNETLIKGYARRLRKMITQDGNDTRRLGVTELHLAVRQERMIPSPVVTTAA